MSSPERRDPRLDEYKRKRDFSRTPEPPGGLKRKAGGIFVVHKHSARALHYDLRLELDGVLKSWAVPKGPCLDPEARRLAVHVEDHPLEYAGFEGTIPKGEYGSGTVMIWDQGFWVPEGDPSEGLSKGALKFSLEGKKLKGRWALVRMKAGRGMEDGKENWLLVKEKDEEAKKKEPPWEETSAATGRTMQEIAREETRENRTPEKKTGGALPELSGLQGSQPGQTPSLLTPQLATSVAKPPAGPGWLHEIKYDGYRILARIKDGEVRLYTRNGNDWTGRFPSIASGLSSLRINDAWLDGEVVFLRQDGTTSFEGLQGALGAGRETELVYYTFDILYFNGYSLLNVPLFERKKILNWTLKASAQPHDPRLRYSDHVEASGPEVLRSACELGLEGIVSKRKDSVYIPARSKEWLKCKCHLRQEFVIGGYTEPHGARTGFGALLLGVYDRQARLAYSGRVGTGFNEKSFKEIWDKLKGLRQDVPPFVNPPKGPDAKGVHWIRPELVVEIEFSQWTREGVLRHPSFQGLREDKNAFEVVREMPGAVKTQGAAPGIQKKEGLIRFTRPGRILYPEHGYTKKDLYDYYEAVSGLMLPHLKGRPLTLVRCPEGYDKGCFFQKHADDNVPKDVRRIPLRESENEDIKTCMMADSLESLLSLVQMGVLEIHTWGSRIERVEYPDKITFDIDPDEGVGWEKLVEAALLMRGLLKELGLKSFVKTTGGKGLHVVSPLNPDKDWDEVKEFTKSVAEYMARSVPKRFTSMMTKSRRAGRIFIDYMRNIRGATAIEAYSTRAKPGAPVSAPLSWDELIEVRADSFNIRNEVERIKAGIDPWQGYFGIRQSITEEMKRMLGAG